MPDALVFALVPTENTELVGRVLFQAVASTDFAAVLFQCHVLIHPQRAVPNLPLRCSPTRFSELQLWRSSQPVRNSVGYASTCVTHYVHKTRSPAEEW